LLLGFTFKYFFLSGQVDRQVIVRQYGNKLRNVSKIDIVLSLYTFNM